MKQNTPQTAVEPEKIRDIAASARDRARAEIVIAKIEIKTADSRKPGIVDNCGATGIVDVANCGATGIVDVANCGATIAKE